MMALLSATSGVLAGPITTVHAHMGILFILKGFAVVSIGGFVNPIGILIGGLGFGIWKASAIISIRSLAISIPFRLFWLS